MAVGNVTVTTAANFIPEVWSSSILKATEANLQIAKKVTRYDADVNKFGDTIHVPNLANIAARDKSASTDVSFDTTTEAVTDIVINKHKYVAFKVEDNAKVQAKADLISLYTEKAGYGVAKAIDSDLCALATGFSQTTGTIGAALTDAVIVNSIVLLDEADAPMKDRFFAMRPSSKGDIMKLDKFVLYQNSNKDRVNSWELGQVYGVEIIVSTNVLLTDVASTDTENNFMFQREAIGLAMQMNPKVESDYNVRSLAHEVVTHTIYGVKEMRDSFGVWVKS